MQHTRSCIRQIIKKQIFQLVLQIITWYPWGFYLPGIKRGKARRCFTLFKALGGGGEPYLPYTKPVLESHGYDRAVCVRGWTCLIPAGHGVVAAKPREPCHSSRLSSVHCTNVSVRLSSLSPAVCWCVRARCGRFSKRKRIARKRFFCCLLRNLSEWVSECIATGIEL